jgi:uncharacterized OB-fold protein
VRWPLSEHVVTALVATGARVESSDVLSESVSDARCPDCGTPASPLAAACESCGRPFLLAGATATGSEEDPGARCVRCDGAVRPDASYCRHCGYTAREWSLVPVLLMGLGFILTASLVGAVVGIPLQLLALRLFRQDGTITAD